MATNRNGGHEADEALIEALATGATYEEAGRIAGKAGRTVRRRMTDPEFAAAVSARRGERMSRITGQLVDLCEQATGVLAEGMGGFEIYPKLRAAQIALNLSLRYRAASELEDRLTAIERRLAERDGSEGGTES